MPTPPVPERRVTPDRDEYFGGARLLASDAKVAFVLLNEARYRAIERFFGVPREKSFLVTVVALGTLAHALEGKAQTMLQGPNPSVGDMALGATVLKELVHGVAGDWSRETPLFGTLVAIAVAGATVRPVVEGSVRGIRGLSHRVRADFDHRYGHLVRPNRDPDGSRQSVAPH